MIVPIPLRISHAYLIKSEKPVLVDTGCPGEEAAIVKALAQENLVPDDLELIVHTHAHLDHAGSTAALQLLGKMPCLVQEADAEDLKTGHNTVPPTNSIMGLIIKKLILKPYPPVKPDLVLQEEMDLHIFNIPARLLHTPGHTPGSCSVVFDSGEAIVGDLLMGGWLGGYIFPKIPGYHYFVNDKEALHRSIRKLLDAGVHTFYCGHGGPLSGAAVTKKFGM